MQFIPSAPLQIERPDETPNVPLPQPADLNPVTWQIITSSDPERNAEILPPTEDWVYYVITPQEYETLSLNQAEMLRWAREAMGQLRYYRGEPLSEEAQ